MGDLWRGTLVAILASAAHIGCSDSTHPKNLHFDGGGGGGGIAGSTGCALDPYGGSSVSGNLVIRDTNFEDKVGFAGKADLTAEANPCGWSEATYDGMAPQPADGGLNRFVLEHLKQRELAWIHLYQSEGSSEDVYPTLNPADTSSDGVLDNEYGFYRASQIDKIYSDTGSTRDPKSGTLVVHLVTGLMATPAAGVTLSTPSGEVAYRTLGGSWQIGGKTEESGMVAVLNATAKPFPGASISVTLSAVVDQTAALAVEEGAVTLGLVSLEVPAP